MRLDVGPAVEEADPPRDAVDCPAICANSARVKASLIPIRLVQVENVVNHL